MSAVKIAGIAVKTATIKELAHERREILVIISCKCIPGLACVLMQVLHRRLFSVNTLYQQDKARRNPFLLRVALERSFRNAR